MQRGVADLRTVVTCVTNLVPVGIHLVVGLPGTVVLLVQETVPVNVRIANVSQTVPIQICLGRVGIVCAVVAGIAMEVVVDILL